MIVPTTFLIIKSDWSRFICSDWSRFICPGWMGFLISDRVVASGKQIINQLHCDWPNTNTKKLNIYIHTLLIALQISPPDIWLWVVLYQTRVDRDLKFINNSDLDQMWVIDDTSDPTNLIRSNGVFLWLEGLGLGLWSGVWFCMWCAERYRERVFVEFFFCFEQEPWLSGRHCLAS